EVEGRPTPPSAQPTFGTDQVVALNYLRAMGTRLVRGRDFTAQDTAGAPRVAMINEWMARHLFPNENPLGKRLRIAGPSAPLSDAPLCEIVGVVEDVNFDLGERAGPVAYRPLAQHNSHSITLVVHTKGDPKAQIAAVRSAVQAIDDNLPAQ